jgi:hypothetical protein
MLRRVIWVCLYAQVQVELSSSLRSLTGLAPVGQEEIYATKLCINTVIVSLKIFFVVHFEL